MISQKLLIRNKVGLHMRPAAMFAEEMMKYECDVTIIFHDAKINAKSILNLMTAGIRCGDEFELQCDGVDEQQAAAAAAYLIDSDFAEE